MTEQAPSYPSPSFVSFGFTLVEVLIATAIMTVVGCAFVSLIVSAQSIARLQPEAADQQQRARMAVQALAAVAAVALLVERHIIRGLKGRHVPDHVAVSTHMLAQRLAFDREELAVGEQRAAVRSR